MPPKTLGARRRAAEKEAAEALGGIPVSVVRVGVLGTVVAAWLAWQLISSLQRGLPPEITPLDAPKLKQLPEFQEEQYRSRMLWGSYRSGFYFGMRTRTPAPLVAGLMWFDPDHADTVYSRRVRHEATQDDKLTTYGWLRHDGVSYGRQQLIDRGYNLSVTLVKQEGAGFGGDWAVRVAAARTEGYVESEQDQKLRRGYPPPTRPRISLVFYVADTRWESAEVEVLPDGQPQELGDEPLLLAAGDNEDVGPWALHAAPSATGGPPSELHYAGVLVKQEQEFVQLKEAFLQLITATAVAHQHQGLRLHLPDTSTPGTNLAMLQITLELPGAMDFVFVTQGAGAPASSTRLAALHGDALTALALERELAYEARFAATFPELVAAGGHGDGDGDDASGAEGSNDADAEQVAEAAKAALSNLVGSMGYFYGASRVQLPPGTRMPGRPAPSDRSEPVVASYWEDALYTAVPSRSFFPRGFLWDEGFHQLLLQRWDPRLSREALAHWLDLMNKHGWIPREQILGAEARARVPAEFITQHPSHANPPSLFLPLLEAAQQLDAPGGGWLAGASGSGSREAGVDAAAAVQAQREFLAAAWPRLEAWYQWFNTTQAGPVPGSYRWRGRNATTTRELNPKTLMSGLDDYPRASHPSPDERHLDLRCWMALASDAMSTIGRAVSAPSDAVARYQVTAQQLSSLGSLKKLHYSEALGQFLDWGLHSEDVALVRRSNVKPDGQPESFLEREVRQPPQLQHVPAYGYVSLFPLLMQLLPAESPELGQQIAMLRDNQLLWTPHGLRSLAPTSSTYKQYNTEHDPPYWRGQIWANLNYLALRALHHYASQPGPHAGWAGEVYQELRTGLLNTLAGGYARSGYLWEQYSDDDGRGMGSHPFTGWTALVTLVAAESW